MSVEPIAKPKPKPTSDGGCPHVIRAINAVTAELAGEGIGKTRNNQQQGYKFRGIDEVLNTLARILADQKLVVVPHVRDRALVERQTKSGGALFSVTVNADYTFISADDGSQFTVGPFYGEAMDSADKATNKAMSAAYKYMAIQTFCIPTEGDNDADATTHEVVAAGERNPSARPQKVLNPETGRMVDPNSAHQLRKSGKWDSFVDAVQSYVDSRDADGLKIWWKSDDTQDRIKDWAWRDDAQDHYERALERIDDLERGR